MAVTPSRFFKVILASSLEDKKLKIPEMFVRKFGDELSTVATLTVPNGRAWKVGLMKDGQKIWLREGLQDFMEYHSICAGYFLVFKYRKNSDFSVRIFDMSACEVNYACNGKDASNEKKNSIHQDEVATQDSATLSPFLTPLGCKVFRGCTSKPQYQEMSSVSRVNQEKQIELDQIRRHKMEEMEVMSESKEPELNLTAKYYSRRSLHCKRQQSKSIEYFAPCLVDKDMDKTGRTEFEKSKHYGEDEHKTVVSKYKDNQDLLVQVEHEGRMRFTFYESASARKRMATAEDREKVINAAKSFEPTNPFCRVVLRPSYLYRGCIMYLPSCFAEKHLNGISGFIKLQMPNGKQWPVRCLYKGGRAKFSQGWYEFTLENNLGEGDVCVFEVLRVKDFVLKVTAFRIMERTGYVNRLP